MKYNWYLRVILIKIFNVSCIEILSVIIFLLGTLFLSQNSDGYIVTLFRTGGIPNQTPFSGNDVMLLLFQEDGKALNCVNNCFHDTFGFQSLMKMAFWYV